MNVVQKLIQLSRSEVEYLRQASFLPLHLAEIVRSGVCASDESLSLHVSREVAEGFRSALTDRLAKAGFGVDYELTDEGRLLEDLIDRFYVGDGT
jgi:hypothetical protein